MVEAHNCDIGSNNILSLVQICLSMSYHNECQWRCVLQSCVSSGRMLTFLR